MNAPFAYIGINKMNGYEVIHLKGSYKNYTSCDNKTSAYTFAINNKPSEVLFKRKKVKEFK